MVNSGDFINVESRLVSPYVLKDSKSFAKNTNLRLFQYFAFFELRNEFSKIIG